MADVFKPVTIQYRDANGKKCRKDTPGARKVEIQSKLWYGRFKNADGGRVTVKLCSDKKVAREMLADLQRKARQEELGLADHQSLEQRQRPLDEHIAEFKADMVNRSVSEEQVGLTLQRLRYIFDGCNFTRSGHIKAETVLAYLAERRGKPRKEGGLSVQSSNYYLGALNQFCRWMVRKHRMRLNPVADVERGNADLDRRHDRRELAPVELVAILEAARTSEKVFRHLAGTDRYFLYLAACGTGFRARELAYLTPALFNLDADPPTVTAPARRTKNKKGAVQPLPVQLAAAFRGYLDGRSRSQRIWPGTWLKKAAIMLQVDLEAAGVPYVVDGPDGPLFADFHALRHTYVTLLERAGVSPRQAQELARHSDIRLTMNTYTHAALADLGEAVNRLALPSPDGKENLFASVPRPTLEALAALGVAWLAFFGPYTVRTDGARNSTQTDANCHDGLEEGK